MRDVKSYFPAITETNEGWKANCPACDDQKKAFNWNDAKQVGCCFHADCRWYYQRGGVTARRLLGFFSGSNVVPIIPNIVEASEPEVGLPEEFRVIEEQKPNLRETLYAYLSSRGISRRVVDKARLGYCENGKHWGYLIFPVFNEDGEVVYWQGRRFKDREPKFINPKSSRKTELIYRINPTARPKKIVLLESILNVLTLENMSVGATTVPIGLFGKTISLIQIQKVLEVEKYLREIIIALDPDARREAIGIAEQFSFLQEIPGNRVLIKIPRFPANEDVNSLGREKSWELIREAPLFEVQKRTSDILREQKLKGWYF